MDWGQCVRDCHQMPETRSPKSWHLRLPLGQCGLAALCHLWQCNMGQVESLFKLSTSLICKNGADQKPVSGGAVCASQG